MRYYGPMPHEHPIRGSGTGGEMKHEEAEARIDAHFDALDAVIARIRAQMVADGLIREPGSRTRDGDVA